MSSLESLLRHDRALAMVRLESESTFSSLLDNRLQNQGVSPGLREALLEQSAALDVPEGVSSACAVAAMIEGSYVDAFRRIALSCSLAALLGALVARQTVRPGPSRGREQAGGT
jgi:hypothetical protein